MKYVSVFLTSLCIASAFAQWLPSCSWNDCMHGWYGSSCDSNSGWDCLCSNVTAIAQVNTCVATSCTNTTEQEAIYGAIAQLCANKGVTITNSQEATFSATPGGSVATITGAPGWGPGGRWGPGAWSSWISACSSAVGSAPSGWQSGPWGGWRSEYSGGPWGGPWGTKASGIACSHWTTWTAGWGPYSAWTGTWSGCSTTTASPSPATVTRTITTNGATSVVTGTTFGVQAQVAAVSTGSSSAAAAPSNSAPLSLFGGAAAAMFGLMVAL